MNESRVFVVWAPSFNPSGGGSIVLHYLCHLINDLGYQAYIWPNTRSPNFRTRRYCETSNMPTIQKVMRLGTNIVGKDIFYLHPDLRTPIANSEILERAIVVYPEIVDGNPLNAVHVIRWLLHKPGFHTGTMNFGRDDLLFYYHSYFGEKGSNDPTPNILRIRWIRDDIYFQRNFALRRGSCYMLRKGAPRPDAKKIKGSIRIDYFGHQRIAKIFNRKKYFYSYDLYTMYCVYAALSGCIPVVVPQKGVSKEDWRPDPVDRFGIAYGQDDIDWAVETKSKLVERIYKEKANEREAVMSFIDKCQKHF